VRPYLFFGFHGHHNVLPEDFVGQGFLRGPPKWLAKFRGIDGVEPNLHLLLLVIQAR
jgi:hypothetical protein